MKKRKENEKETLDSYEKEILESYEKDEWESLEDFKEKKAEYTEYAAATFKKDKRINIRISGNDLTGLKVKAREEGIPYQTLVSSVLHKYVSGRLVERS
ncbi:MAG: antitoxin [Candidatus Krumholzibacteria bacterium]|nr:antitoxin [Candidatus Krumholzibacteria bacterium]